MKTVIACLIGCCLVAPASAQTLRERLKERVRNRLEKAPAPQATSSAVTSAGTFTFSVESGGRTRFYKLHIPKKLDLSKPAPVVFAFHGGGGDMEYQSRDDRYGFIGKSDSEGFAVVFPNGYSRF